MDGIYETCWKVKAIKMKYVVAPTTVDDELVTKAARHI